MTKNLPSVRSFLPSSVGGAIKMGVGLIAVGLGAATVITAGIIMIGWIIGAIVEPTVIGEVSLLGSAPVIIAAIVGFAAFIFGLSLLGIGTAGPIRETKSAVDTAIKTVVPGGE